MRANKKLTLAIYGWAAVLLLVGYYFLLYLGSGGNHSPLFGTPYERLVVWMALPATLIAIHPLGSQFAYTRTPDGASVHSLLEPGKRAKLRSQLRSGPTLGNQVTQRLPFVTPAPGLISCNRF